MSDAGRFAWYATGGTALLGLLAGFASVTAMFGGFLPGALTLFLPGVAGYASGWNLQYAASGPAVRTTALTLWALWGAVALAYVALPGVVTAFRLRRDDATLGHLLQGVVAVLPVPALLTVVWLASERPRDGRWYLVLALLVAVVVLLAAGYRSRRGATDAEATTAATFLNVTVLVVFLVAYSLGQVGAVAASAEALTVEREFPPHAEFEFEYESTGDGRGVLTVTHDAGDRIRASNLEVVGEGIVAVDGAAQTAEGPWQGEATGRRLGGERTVAADDAVTVGVEGDCVVRVVWSSDGGDATQTLAKYECGA